MLYEACWGIFEGNSGPIERQFRSFCVPWEIRVTANMRPESLILRRFRFCEILFLISDALENRAPGSFRRARLKIPDLNPTAKDYPRDITVIVDFFPPSLAFIPIAVPVILVPLPLPSLLSLSHISTSRNFCFRYFQTSLFLHTFSYASAGYIRCAITDHTNGKRMFSIQRKNRTLKLRWNIFP